MYYDTIEKFNKFQGNLEPRRLKSLLNYMEEELYNYVVNRKVQRPSIEDRETNKMLKNISLGTNIPNCSHPILDDEMVRYPLKGGKC